MRPGDRRYAEGLSPRVRGSRRHVLPSVARSRSIPACAGEPKPPEPPAPFRGVYPRVCGGALAKRAKRRAKKGLSPRVRGSLGRAPEHPGLEGSIPACAGEPTSGRDRPRLDAVYPRVCGGAEGRQSSRVVPNGLSPRVRGSPKARIGALDLPQGVYPRVCGGALSHIQTPPAKRGLSPRVRGSPTIVNTYSLLEGSIPACAGEPCQRQYAPCSIEVYPRVCGGAAWPRFRSRNWVGLSPRVRGSRTVYLRGGGCHGSIPACAGEPCWPPTRRLRARVYPRVCGGALAKRAKRRAKKGLSPRVRGSLGRAPEHPGLEGSIPACAGEPTSGRDRPRLDAVYPRVCGGAEGRQSSRVVPNGLSPRVRGSRPPATLSPSRRGSIPACAGEPRCLDSHGRPDGVYPRVCGGALSTPIRAVLH